SMWLPGCFRKAESPATKPRAATCTCAFCWCLLMTKVDECRARLRVTPRGRVCAVVSHMLPRVHFGKRVTAKKAAKPMSQLLLRILYFEDLSVGMTETLSKTIAASDVVGFAQLTGDRNPIHLSEHFAAKTQFGKRIAHGLYTASLISAVLGTRLPGPGAVYIS